MITITHSINNSITSPFNDSIMRDLATAPCLAAQRTKHPAKSPIFIGTIMIAGKHSFSIGNDSEHYDNTQKVPRVSRYRISAAVAGKFAK
jgi:hypothetical protein